MDYRQMKNLKSEDIMNHLDHSLDLLEDVWINLLEKRTAVYLSGVGGDDLILSAIDDLNRCIEKVIKLYEQHGGYKGEPEEIDE